MRIAAAVAVLALVIGCTRTDPGSASRMEFVSVERSGSAARGERVGAAALLRVSGSQSRGPIRLELSFVDDNGRELATTRDGLRFCPPRAECWWGATFFTDDYGGAEIARVRVETQEAEPFGDDDEVQAFTVRRGDDGVVRGEAPGTSGVAYVIASTDGRPRWGTSVNLSGVTTVAVPPDLLPRLDDEELRGTFYPGPGLPSD